MGVHPRLAVILSVLAILVGPPRISGAQESTGSATTAAIDIPYQKFVLDNGLTLIVHEDHKAPIVAVNVWYHVGSKNEKPGKTGFAHLFEHLMFNGSEHFNDDYFQPFERVGATDMNGTTNPDRTNYFQNVPTPALDLALWMESDRMGNMLPVVDQARLDEQRGVVQNEKRQGENQPYGVTRQLLSENTYPEGHPYSWTTIGSMEDLDAAALEDVHEWFETYYGAANAVIAVAGDVEAEAVRGKVERYFGWIPSGPPIARQDVWIAKMEGTHRQRVQDRVPQARVYMTWNVPPLGSADHDYLDLTAGVLSTGKTSRLYKRLVYDDRIATDVDAFVIGREIGSQFRIQATAQPGQDLAAVERAIEEELARFLEEGPTAEELARIQTVIRADFLTGIERIGGFGGKSDVLAMSEVYGGSPDAYKAVLDRLAGATTEDVHEAAREWLSDGVYILEVHPFPQYATGASDVDRSGLPFPDSIPAAVFPEVAQATLANGLEVLLVERHDLPLVRFHLQLDAGTASDQGAAPGTANLAMEMLDEGTASRDALEISAELDRLGAELFTGSDLDASTVTMSALGENLEAALDLYADVVQNPAFPGSELERIKSQTVAAIRREMVDPFDMGLRILPALLFPEGHAYEQPLTGTGTIASVEAMTPQDLADWHAAWFRPGNATLIVVGDVTLEELRPRLETAFGAWPAGDVPEKEIGPVDLDAEPVIYLLDRPGAEQSVIFAADLAPPKANPDEIAFETMNLILGGSFTSRINMNLREDKHWSYGARTAVIDAAGPRPFLVGAPVQTDRTSESMVEIAKELRGIRGEIPITGDELSKAQARQTLMLPGQWETSEEVADAIAEIVRFGLGLDYYDTYAAKVRGLSLDQVSAIADATVHPDDLLWVVVGDRQEIEAGIQGLDWGPIRVLDPDGNLVVEGPAAR
ncbi:MAG TPA: pitrilysin family protein [Gemmatimonadota bacterium]|nr:pitrilysin family protein [Gemmatimonadota bacterium]